MVLLANQDNSFVYMPWLRTPVKDWDDVDIGVIRHNSFDRFERRLLKLIRQRLGPRNFRVDLVLQTSPTGTVLMNLGLGTHHLVPNSAVDPPQSRTVHDPRDAYRFLENDRVIRVQWTLI